jgi:signal transduction histidine kinase
MNGMAGVRLLAVAVHTEQDVVLARQRARQIAALLGFELQAQTRIGTATSEIVRNAFRYAGGGRAEFQFVSEPRRCLVITVSDSGAGIPQLAEVLAGKYHSTTGMGMGLLGTRRIMDRVEISADIGKGTTIRMCKFMPDSLPPVSPDAFARISATLGRGLPGDAIAEVQQQNQELLAVLSELGQRQSELLAVNRDLEDANRGVVALNAELDAGAEVLRRTIEVKTRFLSNMTHEFRTPLNSIIALATMLFDRTDGKLSPEQERQVGFIKRSATELSTLVNDLLDIAKAEAGKVVVRAADFEVEALFGALKGMLKPLLGPGLYVVLEFGTPEPAGMRLHSDEGKVAQILRNLIANALKFTTSGSVRVNAAAGPDGRVSFTVTDTGVGIKPEHLTGIFEEFGQIESGVPQRFKGSGLGLPLAKRLAGLLGGTLDVTSVPRQGSTFRLTLPARYAGPGEGTLIVVEDAPPAPGKRKVILIDDDDVSRYLMRSLFLGNWVVNEVEDGEAAVAKTARLSPAVVFINMRMRGGQGVELLRQLKLQSAAVKVVVYSSIPEEPVAAGAFALADAVFTVGRGSKAGVSMTTVLGRLGLLDDDRDTA